MEKSDYFPQECFICLLAMFHLFVCFINSRHWNYFILKVFINRDRILKTLVYSLFCLMNLCWLAVCQLAFHLPRCRKTALFSGESQYYLTLILFTTVLDWYLKSQMAVLTFIIWASALPRFFFLCFSLQFNYQRSGGWIMG